MEKLLTVSVAVFAILQIVLFFKLCGMTNNVRDMNIRLSKLSDIILISSKPIVRKRYAKNRMMRLVGGFGFHNTLKDRETVIKRVDSAINLYGDELNGILNDLDCEGVYSIDEFRSDLINEYAGK
mgnify:FL=1